jgi:hypothetical protein
MNPQIALVVSTPLIEERKFQLTVADEVCDSAAEASPIKPDLIVEEDPEKLRLRSLEQNKHSVGAERTAVNFWRNARDKADSSHKTGSSKFESCAYLAKPEKQLYEKPNMGELECLKSSLAAANKNRILKNYASNK